MPTSPPGADREPLARADALAEAGRATEAVDLLAAANRLHPDPAFEARLVELRYQAALTGPSAEGRAEWPPLAPDPAPGLVGGLPEIEAADLDAEVVVGALVHHGALIVRGLVDDETVERCIEVTTKAESARLADAGDDRWYRPFPHVSKMQPALRKVVAEDGGTWLADSPAATATMLDVLDGAGVIGVAADYFGERPHFSLQKSTLRRYRPLRPEAGWHQDGSFLGPGVRTLNAWLAFSQCGIDEPRPGLEVVPQRVPEVLEVGSWFSPHAVHPDLVAEVATTGTIVPDCAPGDGMLFDELFLHRSYLTPHMTEDRFALECWFFAPSHPSPEYVPLLV
jgi:hypothetical protein